MVESKKTVLIQDATLKDVEDIVKKAVGDKLSTISKGQPHQEAEKKEFPKFVKRVDTARILGVSTNTLDEWTRAGIIRCNKISKRIYYSEEEIKRALGYNE